MSSATSAFEVLPFRTDGEAQSEEVRRRMGTAGARPPGTFGAKRPLRQGLSLPHRDLRKPIGGYGRIWSPAGPTLDYTQVPASASPATEQIRWVQFALNQIMNANLPTDGYVSPDLRAALRDFQSRNGLPASGFIGPDTIAALQRGGGSGPGEELSSELSEVGPKGIDQATMTWARSVLGKIDAAIGNEPARTFVNNRVPSAVPKVKGLYRITWGEAGPYHGKKHMYNGKAGNLFIRLQQHAKEVRQLGFTLDGFEVRVLPQERCTSQQLRALEWVINDKYFRQPGVTNERRELELPEVGAF